MKALLLLVCFMAMYIPVFSDPDPDSVRYTEKRETLAVGLAHQQGDISRQENVPVLGRGAIWGSILLGIIVFLIYRGKKHSDALAEERRQTRQQLILQEKMASLGQTTAGIAHEIKNPLNFVTNFAEGVDEIITDVKEHLKQYQQSQNPKDFQLLVDYLNDIRKYNQNILNHGNRANQIVSSMMNHANDFQGAKVPSDLNHVLTTNLNLAQHGYLPQQKSFLVEITQDFDPEIPEITLNPQELGRVLINLINNACHALEQKQQSVVKRFQPAIHVSSKLIHDRIEIRVRDNGPGIPEEIRAQIFQPFFTTKPPGKGNSGLGLSISYDIVRQGLQGQLNVESEEGLFTEFILSFPIQ